MPLAAICFINGTQYMEDPKPKKRRWFRFSLRTMFVLVTVFCGLLGWVEWNRRIMQERKASFRGVSSGEYLYATTFSDDPAPCPRNLMGDQMLEEIFVKQSCPDRALDRLRAAYSEALIHICDDKMPLPEW